MHVVFRHTFLSVVLLCGLACKKESPAERTLPLKEQARHVMEIHCGRCHIPEENPNLPKALQVFNLREENWAGRMTASQLKALKSRIEDGEFFDPFDVRNEGKSPPPKPTPEELRIVQDYSDELLAKMPAVDAGR